MAEIDLDALRIETPSRPASRLPRHARGTFVRGPIPLDWLARAAALPGHALHVALLVWFRVGLQGRGPVLLTTKLLSRFGVSRYSMYRAIDALARAGVIRIEERRRGRAPVVDLCLADLAAERPSANADVETGGCT